MLDVDTGQPLCFTTGTSARTAATAAEELLKLAADILDTEPGQMLVLADSEHFTVELLDRVKTGRTSTSWYRCLISLPCDAKLTAVAAGDVPAALGGLCDCEVAYTPQDSQAGPFYQYVQREGERPEDYRFNAFLATRDGNEVEELTDEFPKRWHVEEFFNAHQALGWNRGRDLQSQHSLRPDDDGLARSGGDRSASQTACPAHDELGREAHGHGLLRGVWRETCGSLTVIRFSSHIIMLPMLTSCRAHYENLPAKLRGRERSTRGFPGSTGLSSISRFR